MDERNEKRIDGEEFDPIGFTNPDLAKRQKEEMYSSRPDILAKEIQDEKERMLKDNKAQHYYLVCISHFNGERNWEEFNSREEFRIGVMMILSINHEDVNNDGEKVDIVESFVLSSGMTIDKEGACRVPLDIAMKAIEKNFDDPDLYEPFDVEDYIVEVL